MQKKTFPRWKNISTEPQNSQKCLPWTGEKAVGSSQVYRRGTAACSINTFHGNLLHWYLVCKFDPLSWGWHYGKAHAVSNMEQVCPVRSMNVLIQHSSAPLQDPMSALKVRHKGVRRLVGSIQNLHDVERRQNNDKTRTVRTASTYRPVNWL